MQPHDYVMIPKKLLAAEMKPSDVLLWITLSTLVNEREVTHRFIAHRSGLSISTTQRSIKALVGAGWLKSSGSSDGISFELVVPE
ncbi:helix-turn-helix DNA binding domain protein [Microbacterium phage ValentiniPuff]|uniref:Helix-turn-helix DNA binding domain protein n=1 Tax=Microbacterium phage ValentiniPuff TaxID=2315705 RepID=A0A386KQV8_9CAUD|nr:helix-turn-helix DNA binding domain protein [Microbacterium phage ValentiniPuff]